MEPEPKLVKCVTCGFASKRARDAHFPSINRDYYEIPFDERRPEGLVAVHNIYYGNQRHTSDIACFRGKVDLGQLAERHYLSLDKPDDLSQLRRWELRGRESKGVLEEDRACEYWYPYVEGRTPQEHLADYMAAELEQKRKAFELELFRMSQKVQEDSKAIADSTRRITWWIGFIAIVLTLGQIILGVLGYLASRKPVYVPVPVIQQTEAEPKSLQQ